MLNIEDKLAKSTSYVLGLSGNGGGYSCQVLLSTFIKMVICQDHADEIIHS